MRSDTYQLPNGDILTIREALPEDAAAVLNYINLVSAESDFLGFGAGEFELTETEEREVLQRFLDADTQLYLVGIIATEIVAVLNFSGGRRSRVRHVGEFGMSVQKKYWGNGIGGLLLNRLLEWAKETNIITKINLRVRTDNQRAITLYQNKGFVIEGTIINDLYVGNCYYSSHIMGIVL